MGSPKTIDVGIHGIVVHLTGDGGGSITSDLHEDQAGAEDVVGFAMYEAKVDSLESLVLAQAMAGIDITTPAYKDAINTWIDAVANQ